MGHVWTSVSIDSYESCKRNDPDKKSIKIFKYSEGKNRYLKILSLTDLRIKAGFQPEIDWLELKLYYEVFLVGLSFSHSKAITARNTVTPIKNLNVSSMIIFLFIVFYLPKFIHHTLCND